MPVTFGDKSVGQHGANIFYKEFTVFTDTATKTYSLGSFIFVQKPPYPVTIAEFQLIWKNTYTEKKYACVKLYFDPTDEEDIEDDEEEFDEFSQDEVVEANRQIVIECSEVPRWESSSKFWNKDIGRRAFSDVDTEYLKALLKKDKLLLTKNDENMQVKILSYPQYCRYMTCIRLMKMGVPMGFGVYLARGGLQLDDLNTLILFTRSVFRKIGVDEFSLTRNVAVPVFRGRPTKKKKKEIKLERMKKQKKILKELKKWKKLQNGSKGKCDFDHSSVSSAASRIINKYKKRKEKHEVGERSENVEGKNLVNETFMQNEFPQRETFLSDLYKFMADCGKPIGFVPSMGKAQVDLFDLYTLVMKAGGHAKVTMNKQWREIYDGLGKHSNDITNAATSVRKIYENLLLSYEKAKRKEKVLEAVEDIPLNCLKTTLEGLEKSTGKGKYEMPKETKEFKEIPLKEDKSKRSKFLSELYKYMEDCGKPIGFVPSMGRAQVDLYDLYTHVMKSGGHAKVTMNKQWREIYEKLGRHSTDITNAATSARKIYENLLLSYEIAKRKDENLEGDSIPPRFLNTTPIKCEENFADIESNSSQESKKISPIKKPKKREKIKQNGSVKNSPLRREFKKIDTPNSTLPLVKQEIIDDNTPLHGDSIAVPSQTGPPGEDVTSFTLQAGEAFKLMIQKRRGRPSNEFRQQIEQLKTMNGNVDVKVFPPTGKKLRIPNWLGDLGVNVVKNRTRKKNSSVTPPKPSTRGRGRPRGRPRGHHSAFPNGQLRNIKPQPVTISSINDHSTQHFAKINNARGATNASRGYDSGFYTNNGNVHELDNKSNGIIVLRDDDEAPIIKKNSISDAPSRRFLSPINHISNNPNSPLNSRNNPNSPLNSHYPNITRPHHNSLADLQPKNTAPHSTDKLTTTNLRHLYIPENIKKVNTSLFRYSKSDSSSIPRGPSLMGRGTQGKPREYIPFSQSFFPVSSLPDPKSSMDGLEFPTGAPYSENCGPMSSLVSNGNPCVSTTDNDMSQDTIHFRDLGEENSPDHPQVYIIPDESPWETLPSLDILTKDI